MKSNLLSFAVVVIGIVIFMFHPPAVAWSSTKIVGAVIAGVSFPLFVLARWQLGRSFSVRAEARVLVTTGLYSRIRNPIYLFGGLFLVGLSLFLSAWAPLAVILIIVPLQIYRSRNEEQVLTRAFGEEYVRYKGKTWF